METNAKPFLMFEGTARQAMDLYISLFDDGRIVAMDVYGAEDPGPEGTIQSATFQIAGLEIMCSDSFISHNFTFTPSVSLFVECESEAQIKRLGAVLSQDGRTLMPMDDYGFSKMFTWVEDRFGVSWQLSLP